MAREYGTDASQGTQLELVPVLRLKNPALQFERLPATPGSHSEPSIVATIIVVATTARAAVRDRLLRCGAGATSSRGPAGERVRGLGVQRGVPGLQALQAAGARAEAGGREVRVEVGGWVGHRQCWGKVGVGGVDE